MKHTLETTRYIEEYPLIEYKIKVISMFSKDIRDRLTHYVYSNGELGSSYITSSIEDFIDSTRDGDILLFEYPCWYETRGSDGSGLRNNFRVYVTNLRTNKSIEVMAGKIRFVWRCIEEFEVID